MPRMPKLTNASTGYEQSSPDHPGSHSHVVPRHKPLKLQSFGLDLSHFLTDDFCLLALDLLLEFGWTVDQAVYCSLQF